MIGFHGLNNSYMFEDEQIGTYRPKIEEIINRTPKDHKDEGSGRLGCSKP